MLHIVIRKILFALIRVPLVINFSRKTGVSNLHQVVATSVMDYNKANKHEKLCHMINLDR